MNSLVEGPRHTLPIGESRQLDAVLTDFWSMPREFVANHKTNVEITSKFGASICFCCGAPAIVHLYQNIVPQDPDGKSMSGDIVKKEMFVCVPHYELFSEELMAAAVWMGDRLAFDLPAATLEIRRAIAEKSAEIAGAMVVYSTTEGQ
jgi:hypothetical protein